MSLGKSRQAYCSYCNRVTLISKPIPNQYAGNPNQYAGRHLHILIKGIHFLRGNPKGFQRESTKTVKFQHSRLLACATAEQAKCMEAHNRICFHQNGASSLLVGLGECARDLTKCGVYQKNSNMVLTKAKQTGSNIHELLSNFISPLDLHNSARICSACRIALISSKSKQSAETFVDASKHFQFLCFEIRKGTEILPKKPQQISASGFEVRKSRCSVQQ